MRNDPQVIQVHSVTQVVERHLLALQHDTGMSMSLFVARVREHYEATVLLGSRTVEWSLVADAATRMARDAERFKRWLEPDTAARLPLDMLESVIAAFPFDRRLALQVELGRRQGLLVSVIPTDAVADIVTLGDVARKHGQTMVALAEIFADGVVDEKDRPFAPEAIRQIDGAVAVLLSMRNILKVKALGV
ncbi:MAG: hypothetical protein PHU14_01575 [Methylovulum sp.]|nr:hypothetical protein [Methylovulum sp.]